MEGYEVLTADDEKAGHVVGTVGDNLIVEQGAIFKSKHALPRTFAEVHDDERIVRVTVTKDLIADAPKVSDGEVDEQAVAEYYGLAGGFDSPATEGYGELDPGDPARTAEDDEQRAGLETAEQARLRVRQGMESGTADSSLGRPIIPPDPHR